MPLLLALSVLLSGHVVLVDLHGRLFGQTDTHWAEGVTWWYWNVGTNWARGINPLHNDLHAWPVGYDHIRLIGNFADAALAAPFFWWMEAPAAYNLTVLAWLLLDALASWWMLQRWLKGEGWAGSLLAALLAWVNTFQPLNQFFVEEGRPTQFILAFVYLGLGGVKILLDDPRRGSIWPLAVGLAGAFVCFWFNGFFLGLALPLLGGLGAWGMDASARRALLRRGSLAVGIAVCAAFPFGLPVLFDVLWGTGIPNVQLFTLPDTRHMSLFSARPLSLLAWTPRYGMAMPYSLLAAALLGAGVSMRSGVLDRRSRGAAVGWLLVGLLYYLLTLGPYLRLEDEPLLVGGRLVALPWAWMTWGVPFYSRLSYPYMAFPFLLVVVLVAVAAGLRPLLRRGPGGQLAAVGLGGAVVLEVGLRFGFLLPSSPFHIPDYYHQLAQEDDVQAIIEFPFGAMDYRQVYQTVHRKPMVNSRGNEQIFLDAAPGLADFFAAHRALTALLSWQRSGRAPQAIPAEDLQDLADMGFGRLIVSEQAVRHSERLRHHGYPNVVGDLSRLLGAPQVQTDELTVFVLPAGPSPQAP